MPTVENEMDEQYKKKKKNYSHAHAGWKKKYDLLKQQTESQFVEERKMLWNRMLG